MFAQTFAVQWKWNRDFLGFYTGLAFVAPLAVLWIAAPGIGLTSAHELVAVGGVIGGASRVIALLAGLTIAWQGYGVDDRLGHIYTLSLPVTRGRALALRASTASLMLTLPALGVLAGSLLAASRLTMPATLETYPGALALRALLTAWLAHACMFAVRYGAGRRGRAVVAVVGLAIVALGFTAAAMPAVQHAIGRVGDFLVSNPGPFGVLFGRWTLIDV